MFVETIVFIILFIVAIIVIASASYSSDGKPEIKSIKSRSIGSENFSLNTVIPEYHHNCYVVNINQIDTNTAYIISGGFENSCVSIYLDGERIHSRECNGDTSLVLSSNLSLTSQLFKMNKYKSQLLPLQLDKTYKIVFNNVNDLDVKEYKVMYNISYKNIAYNYTKGTGYNEYDIYELVKNTYPALTRKYLKNGNKENMWHMNDTGNYLVIIINNLYNLNITINEENYNVSKSISEPELIMINITDPSITVFNLDFLTKIKDINQEYLDFITTPNYLMNKFIHGSASKKADYISQVNNKFILYKMV
jgi:hypothetical protein